MSAFSLTCTSCQQENDFDTHDVEGLEEHISAERTDARRLAEEQYSGWIDPSDLRSSVARLAQLSVAIQRGDKAEATILLDQIAASLDDVTLHLVECARFSPQARLPLPHVQV